MTAAGRRSRKKPFARLGLLVISACLITACGDAFREPSSPTRDVTASDPRSQCGPYGYETGIVEFRVRQPFHQVDETIYFRDWGREEARYETVRGNSGETGKTLRHQITIINAEGVFTWQVETRTGSRSPLPPPEPFQDLEKLIRREGAQSVLKRLQSLGFEYRQTEMLLGRTCHVFFRSGGTFWIHRGLMLRSRIRIQDFVMLREAVRFVPDATIDPERFQFPGDVDPSTFPDLNDLLNQAGKDEEPGKRS